MFCSMKMNRKINHIEERALRLVYDDYLSSFDELLRKDNSVCIHHRNIQRVAIEMFKVKVVGNDQGMVLRKLCLQWRAIF